MQVKREAKSKPILKAHVERPEIQHYFPAVKPGKPFVTLAESSEPRLILWQLGVAKKLLFFEVSALATEKMIGTEYVKLDTIKTLTSSQEIL